MYLRVVWKNVNVCVLTNHFNFLNEKSNQFKRSKLKSGQIQSNFHGSLTPNHIRILIKAMIPHN